MIQKFCKARFVPIATNGAIEGELDRLGAAGIVEKVTRSNWAAPIVAVSKKDNGCRIYGDYKLTVNGTLDVYQYLLPNPSEFSATLAGSKTFTKLDLSHPLPNPSELSATLAGGKTFTKLDLSHPLPNPSELSAILAGGKTFTKLDLSHPLPNPSELSAILAGGKTFPKLDLSHPLPNPSELSATLAGGKTFTKLDLLQAYQQLLLDQESTKYVTVNTHSYYRYNRLRCI